MTKTIITIKRPNGDEERVELPGGITDQRTRDRYYTANLDAGRGAILKWEVFTTPAARGGCAHYSAANGCPMHGETCR